MGPASGRLRDADPGLRTVAEVPSLPPLTLPRPSPVAWMRRCRGAVREHRLAALVTTAAAVVYGVYAWAQVELATTLGLYDQGIFFQAISGYAHGRAPVSTIKGLHDYHSATFNLLGDHFHPVIALVAPTLWLYPHPVTLQIDQALLLAASIPFVYRAALRCLGGKGPAAAVAAAYALSWGIQQMVDFGFHEVAFAVPLLAVMIERALAGRWRAAVGVGVALLFVKEEYGLVLAMLGVWAALAGRRRLGAAVFAGGVGAFVLTIRVLIPHFAGGAPYYYTGYAAGLGSSMPAVVWFAVRHPMAFLHVLTHPAAKWHLVVDVLRPVAFVSVLSPVALLAVPLLLVRLVSNHTQLWQPIYHYNGPLMPVMFLAACDTVARLGRWLPDAARPWLGRLAAAVLGALCIASVPSQPLDQMTTPGWFTVSPGEQQLRHALAVVPPGVRVAASNGTGLPLVDRDQVVLFDGRPHQVDYVVVALGRSLFGFHEGDLRQPEYLAAAVAELRRQGWQQVWDANGYVVLRRPGAPTGPQHEGAPRY